MKPILITVASGPKGYFKYFMESANRQGLTPTILPISKIYRGHGMKLSALVRFFKECPNQVTHVVFADAFDVVFARPILEMLREFDSFEVPILFSAERNCSPDRYRAMFYPKDDSPYKYLNSGFWIGRMEALIDMFSQIDVNLIPDKFNDQRLFTDFYLCKKVLITLDHSARICQNLYLSSADIELSDGCVTNRITGTMPYAFHGNGKTDMKSLIGWLKL